MSVQFGRWNFDGKPFDPDYFEKVKPLLARYAADDTGTYSKGSINILYGAFHTTKESHHETQPHLTASGSILTWDGRLDNRAELVRHFRDVVTTGSTDVEIVAAAYEYWRADSFGMLIGDWALSIWNPQARSLLLAKDPIGTRHLYYSFDKNQVTWSTVLDPLVLFADQNLALCEEYIAGWLSFFPAPDVTPYVGIHSVPPSCSVGFRLGKREVTKYWDFDASKKIRYLADAEYEEHFRAAFGEAVRRRLRSDRPVLAELSGGMDSSSIVCMADTIIARGTAESPRLDTISYYNDSEPNWNERPYFTKVEQERGRTGCHINIRTQVSLKSEFNSERFAATPASIGRANEAANQFAACLMSNGNRVLLSGIGGDEVTGGVPTPIPELADLLARAQFSKLAHQLKVWALDKRKPWFHLFFETLQEFLPLALVGFSNHKYPAPWLQQRFVKRNRTSLEGYENRLKLFGPLPSLQENISALNVVRRQLGCDSLSLDPSFEKRYPYLDRNLLEFTFAIPRQQLVRPGQRRSLMRRALVGIVPDELLNRKRKAFVARGPITAISGEWANLIEMREHMITSLLGIVDSRGFLSALQRAKNGQEVSLALLMRTLTIEQWVRDLQPWVRLNQDRGSQDASVLLASTKGAQVRSTTS